MKYVVNLLCATISLIIVAGNARNPSESRQASRDSAIRAITYAIAPNDRPNHETIARRDQIGDNQFAAEDAHPSNVLIGDGGGTALNGSEKLLEFQTIVSRWIVVMRKNS